ncbi:MAG TPA: hypothetical protein VK453_02190 [Micromonosporaceae bacterium]|nr:hypothetical protein [Micromonosporaceae bacterium]
MVHVMLATEWTDWTGADHDPGDLVDVDAVTLAQLEACGVVTEYDDEPSYFSDFSDDLAA